MIADDDYQFLADFLHKQTGLHLGPRKEYLLESRLLPVAATYGKDGIRGLVDALRRGGDAALARVVGNAMTTGETMFFRDGGPFKALEQHILPALGTRPSNAPLRIWCAASSTGQEPYSIAMLLKDLPADVLKGNRIEIVATDINDDALERARKGVYNQFEVQRGLPVQLLVKHFQQVDGGFQLKEELRRVVTFKRLNLLGDFRDLGTFDVIFCRNVLIYFDTNTKRDVLNRLAAAMRPDGFLLLGGTETTFGITDRLVRHAAAGSGVYIRKEDSDLAQARAAG
jgi:chemotaxis protein methyltransferase CheR